MRNSFFLCLIFLCSIRVFAQETEIRFLDGTLEDARKQAAQAGKVLFIDCMGDNCGACRMMEKTVFTVPEVAEFFNEHFINYKLNMNRPEGLAFGKTCEISALPTLIFMDEQGRILFKEYGARKAKEFIELGHKALAREKSDAVRFEEGERGDAFVKGYLNELARVYLNNTFAAVLNTVYAERGAKMLEDRDYWVLFWKYAEDRNCPMALEFVKNSKKYAGLYGNDAVRWKLRHLYASFSCVHALYENEGVDDYGMPDAKKKLLPEKRKEYFALLESLKLPDVKELEDEIDFISLTRDHRYEEAFALGEKSLKRADARRLCDWATLAERTVRERAYRQKMSVWADRAVASGTAECRKEAMEMAKRLKESDNPVMNRTRENGSLPIRK